MASEPVECQVLVLKVSIHCQGCKKKVKKVLMHVDGVYRCDIDARSNKVMVTASTMLDAGVLVARLRKSGKLAEPWPEEPKQQEPSPATENQADDPSKPSEPAVEMPGADNNGEASAAVEPSNAQPASESADEADQEATANGRTGEETKTATGQQSDGAKEKATQQQHDHQEKKPIDATVTVEFDHGGYRRYRTPMTPQPAHVMSYNVARPMASVSYYAAAPTPVSAAPMASASYYAAAPAPVSAAPMPAPMARPGPSHRRYIDEYAPPPSYYYSRAAPPPYEPSFSYHPPQPSPYHHHHQRSPADDYYYYAAPPPQRSAFSPPRDAYGDMFNDDNANSCSVM